MPISPEDRAFAKRLFAEGATTREVAERLDISQNSAWRISKSMPVGVTEKALVARAGNPPRHVEDLGPEPRRAIDDFAFFSERYLARRAVPWRTKTAEKLVDALADPYERFLVLNLPPGAGKSSLAMDLALWSIVRDRAIRVMLGAEVLDRAREYLSAVRRLLEADRPYYDHRRKVEAEAVLAQDFGIFRPTGADLWTPTHFTVEQEDGRDPSSKEPTCQVASRQSGFLGTRTDLAIWDDLATLRSFGDPDLLRWWRQEAESRLEPGGALLLIGQRIAEGDLFGECLERGWVGEEGEITPAYEGITFPAHNEGTCDGDHREWNAEPEGDGCLVDAERLSWKKLQRLSAEPNFSVTYQQVPNANASGLCESVWIYGNGVDSAGVECVGALDKDRGFGELPASVVGLVHYISIDPAQGAGFWAFEHWALHPATRMRWLISGDRGRYSIRDVIDRTDEGVFTGVLEEMVAAVPGGPTAVVIEENAARLLLQSSLFQSWQGKWRGVRIIQHNTRGNRNDPIVGVAALLPAAYRDGLVRLPYGRGLEGLGYLKAKISELTSPKPRTTDTTMAEWCGVSHLDEIIGLTRTNSRARVSMGNMPLYLRRQQQSTMTAPREKPALPTPEVNGKAVCPTCNGEGGFFESDFDDDEGHTVWRDCSCDDGIVTIWSRKGEQR